MGKQVPDKITIYYFSGTGNARSVTAWIKQTSELKNIECEIIDIASLEQRKIKDIPENQLLGICSPTHGFNFPPIMLNFIFRFPVAKKQKVFLINTRAGLKIGKFFIPGLSGLALLLSALILKLKKYKIVGMRSIDLPSNWISLHPGLKPETVKSIFEKRKQDTIGFITKLLENKTCYRAFRDIIQDLLIAPVALLYYIVGRFVFAKSFIASKDCTHCNLCVEKCPVNAIKIVDQRCYWTYKCESCMKCMNICPHRAIETAHGFVIGISFFISFIVLTGIYNLLNIKQFISMFFSSGIKEIVHFIFEWSIFLLLFFFFYRIMHHLIRFRFFERLVVLSSLTKYKFWRRYSPPAKH